MRLFVHVDAFADRRLVVEPVGLPMGSAGRWAPRKARAGPNERDTAGRTLRGCSGLRLPSSRRARSGPPVVGANEAAYAPAASVVTVATSVQTPGLFCST